VSISSTFYVRIFCTYVVLAASYTYLELEKSSQINIRTLMKLTTCVFFLNFQKLLFPWGLTLLEYVPHICANPTPSKKISSSKILPLSFHSILLPFYSSCDVLIDERLKRRWVWLVRSAAKLCQGPEVNPIKKIKSFNRQNYSIISWRCVTSTKLLQWMI